MTCMFCGDTVRDETKRRMDRETLLACVTEAFDSMWKDKTKGCPEGCLATGKGWPFEEPEDEAQGDEKRRDGGT